MFYLQPNFVPFDNTEFDVYNIIKKKSINMHDLISHARDCTRNVYICFFFGKH